MWTLQFLLAFVIDIYHVLRCRYYCPSGAIEPTPADQNCTVGHFCPEGTANPIPCREGTVNKVRAAAECRNCSAGSYCIDGVNELQCPRGEQKLGKAKMSSNSLRIQICY